VPTPILTNNINFLDLLGLRSLSTQTLTITNSFSVGQVVYSPTGIQNAQNIDDILFAAAYNLANPSSTTCGIQEAVNALPTSGGTIYLQRGSCTVTSTIHISVPVVIIGFGPGGFLDNAAFNTFTAGTIITANTSGQPLFSLGNTGTATVSGITLSNFAINGSTAGDLFQIGQTSTTSFLNKVAITDVFTYAAPTCAVNVVGNLNGLNLDRDQFSKGVGSGICLSASGSYSVTGVSIRNTTSARNTIDGLHVASAATQDITVTGSHFDNNGQYGINVLAGSTASVVKSSSNTFTGNKRSMQISDGSGNSTADTLTGNSEYGAAIDTPTSTHVDFTFKDALWGSNTTADIFTGTNTHEVVEYPARVNPTTSQLVAGTVQYITTTPSLTSTRAVATTGLFTTCVMVGHSSTDVSCVGTHAWSTTITGTYYPICSLYDNTFSGGADTVGMTRAVMGITSLTSSSVSYWTSSLQGGTAGATTQAFCVAFQ
jgi:hypothetical protein